MRFFIGLVLTLALGVMGCGETAGTGGSGGGIGGNGGSAGMGGGGAGGDGGHGGGMVVCVDNVCPCSEAGIRAAIAEGGGPFTFDCDGPTTVAIEENLTIEEDLILDGEGVLTLEGGGLNANRQVSLELRGLALSNLEWPIVVALGSLTIVDSKITGSENWAIYGLFEVLTIRNTIISGAGGTAIYIIGNVEPAIIEYSTIERNLDHGISNRDRVGCGPLTIRNTTVSGNGGYGLLICGDVAIINSTVSGNSGDWAVSYTDCDERPKIANSTISGDVRIHGHCGELYPVMAELGGVLLRGSCSVEEWAEVTSLGYNIESPGDTCGFDQPTDQVNVSADDLKLGPLQDNGGPTETHALGEDSVAVDQIPAVDCVDAEGAPLMTDQRGVERPQGSECDVGAVEMEVTP